MYYGYAYTVTSSDWQLNLCMMLLCCKGLLQQKYYFY